MTKQTFTVGQVLTAAQMTSLQQTAMGGGSTTAKTASYVLVAADAGTVVQMNAAGATTITVNTALFAAGDTVQIQNIGAGVCTVTAGTATVNTSSTLALKQYDSGDLYFNSTSAALFFNTDAADGSSPLTTKGDLYGFSTLDARIPIGTNNQVLTADSAEALGLKWATPASGSMTLLSTTAITTAASITLSSISGSYQSLILNVDGAYENTTGIFLQFNSDATSIYYSLGMRSSAGNYVESTQASSSICIATSLRFPVGSGSGSINVYMPMYASATTPKLLTAIAATGNGAEQRTGQWADITAVTSLKITMGTPTAQGTMYLYGVK